MNDADMLLCATRSLSDSKQPVSRERRLRRSNTYTSRFGQKRSRGTRYIKLPSFEGDGLHKTDWSWDEAGGVAVGVKVHRVKHRLEPCYSIRGD